MWRVNSRAERHGPRVCRQDFLLSLSLNQMWKTMNHTVTTSRLFLPVRLWQVTFDYMHLKSQGSKNKNWKNGRDKMGNDLISVLVHFGSHKHFWYWINVSEWYLKSFTCSALNLVIFFVYWICCSEWPCFMYFTFALLLFFSHSHFLCQFCRIFSMFRWCNTYHLNRKKNWI